MYLLESDHAVSREQVVDFLFSVDTFEQTCSSRPIFSIFSISVIQIFG